MKPLDYFDLYIKTDEGFVATKGKIIAIAEMNFHSRRYSCALYVDRQKSKRCFAHIGGFSAQETKTHLIKYMEESKDKQ